MADLTDLQSSQSIKIVGSDPTGIETTPVGTYLTNNLKVATLQQVFPTFIAMSMNNTLALNKSIFSIVNNSTDVVRIREIKLVNTQISALTGVVADLRFLRITNHSGGILTVPLTLDTSDTLPVGITVSSGAVVAGEIPVSLFRYLWSTDEWGVGPSDVESIDHVNQTLIPVYEPKLQCKPLTLRPSQGLSIKNVTNTSNGTFDIVVTFTVEDD